MPLMTEPLAVYIPNFDGGERLLGVLDSLAEQTVSARVILIDNGSTDGSPNAVEEHHDDVILVRLSHNIGFGRALDAGVRAHPAKRLVFVNNDVVCQPRFLEALLDTAGAGPAMIAGVLLQHTNPGLIDSAGVAADHTLLAWDYLHGEPIARAAMSPPPLGPTGGAALYEFESFVDVGGFDDHIFAYLEDVDIALRLRLRGVTCRLAPDARAIHYHSSTLGSGSPEKNRLMGWSRGYMLNRYRILRQPRLAARAVFVEAVIALGQIAVDRNWNGISGRFDGWRDARGLPRREFTREGLTPLSTRASLRRRALRRSSPPSSAH